jgi:transglutaminase-like putative cysteine protease
MRVRQIARLLSGALALGAVIDARVAEAGSAPEWMHAQVGVPLPAHDDKTSAVLLYSATTLVVDKSGKIKRLDRKAYKILRPEGERRGTVRIDFDSQSRITDMHAWCIPTAGKDYEVKEKDAVESAILGVDGSELVSDSRSKLLRIPAATPGSIVGYEVEQEQRPYVMADEWEFQDTVPVREAHYTLQLPPGWSYRETWLNHAAIAPATAGAGQSHWVINDVAAIKVEADMPPWQGIAGKMVIALMPANGQNHGFQSWQEMGTWYQTLSQGRRDPTPEIKQKVNELTAQVPTALGKIQALAGFVQRDIRYVAIELGIGGIQPHPATQVFAQRYGDCKDKATLLSTMLHEIGVESYYVIINTTRGSVTAATPPNLGFNHVILAVQLPAGVEAATLPAFIAHPKLGRVLFFDPTDSLTPFGRLAGPLQANYGLLVGPDGGELLALPQLPSASNAIQRTAKLTLDENGTLKGDVHEIWTGDQAAYQRNRLRSARQESEKIRSVESLLSHSFTTFKILNATIGNLPAIEVPLEWNYSVEAERYAKATGNLLLVRPRVLGSKASDILEDNKEPRQYPIEFDGPERDTDVFEIALPAGYAVDEVPPPVSAEYGFASYHSATEIVGHTLRYTRTFEIKDLSVPVSKTDKLRELYRIIDNDERMSAVLTRASP